MPPPCKYQKLMRVLVDIDISPSRLITISAAAKRLGTTISNLSLKTDKGQLTTIIDTTAPLRQGRRLLLLSEIDHLCNLASARRTIGT